MSKQACIVCAWVMLFGSQTIGGEILFLSRFNEPVEGGFSHADHSFIDFLEELGHEVDTSFMNRPIPPARFASDLYAAAEDADVIIVSTAAPATDTLSFGGCGPREGFPSTFPAFDASLFKSMDRPMLIMDAETARFRSVTKIALDNSSEERIQYLGGGSRFFLGIDKNTKLFEWDSAEAGSIENVRNPTMTLGRGSGRDFMTIYAKYEDHTILSELPDGTNVTANRRVFLGNWDYYRSFSDFFDFVTDDYKTLLGNIVSDLVASARKGELSANILSRFDFNENGFYDVDDIEILSNAIRDGEQSQRYDVDENGVVDHGDRASLIDAPFFTYIGDSNLDGEFNSSDIVQTFQIGMWETGDTATWAQGDWNGDQRFDSGDFVAAFQDGGFCIGPREAVHVPEIKMTLLGVLSFCFFSVRNRKRLRKID